MSSFRVGVTYDLARVHESTGIDVGLGLLADAGLDVEILPDTGVRLEASRLADLDGLLLLKPRVTNEIIAAAPRLSIVARWGVGYDNIDVTACSRHGVLCTLTPDGVRRPMAVAMLTMLLALSTNVIAKHDVIRSGGWDREAHLGTGLTGRTLGLVGLGNIGQELLRLVAPLEMRHVAYDPVLAEVPRGLPPVRLASLEEVLRSADFLCICCPLTPETRHLIDAARLAQLKSTAYLINAARGPIVDEGALAHALQAGRIAGAALDVFDVEPLPADSPLRSLHNVVLSPHSLGWTDETLTGNGRSACQALVDVSQGRVPANLLNPEVLAHPRQRRRLDRGAQGLSS